MTSGNGGDPTLLIEEEEVLGDPSFELWVRNGEPVVSGCYFVHPPLRAVSAEWSSAEGGKRLVVQASDGSEWFADDVPVEGSATVVLSPLKGHHPAFPSAAVRIAARAEDDVD
jgi:hypothetical protein